MNVPGGFGALAPQKPIFQARPNYGRAGGPSPMGLMRPPAPAAASGPRLGLSALAPHFAPQLMPRFDGRGYGAA